MESVVVANCLMKLEFGEVQRHENMSAVPLFVSNGGGLRYLTLKEALDGGVLVISEVSTGGTVPELKVKNSGDLSVLLLDGEELMGAKQNRVLNTTILLKGHSEMLIPVSCTEAGRWSYNSERFSESGHIMAHQVRREKHRSVSKNLDQSRTFRSDQGEVWENIAKLANDAGVDSPTRAMRDVHESMDKKIDDYLAGFPCQPGQKGALVSINGKVAGLDLLSLEAAYGALHLKLMKSYAIDALLQKTKDENGTVLDRARAFLAEAHGCGVKKYKSAGEGWDLRFEGKGIVGSALVHEDTAVHTAFFRISESQRIDNMSSYRRRRSFRT